jgi:hypothetical protein
LGQIWANEFAATQSDVRLRGQYLLPMQVGMAMACCDLQSPQLAPKLNYTRRLGLGKSPASLSFRAKREISCLGKRDFSRHKPPLEMTERDFDKTLPAG